MNKNLIILLILIFCSNCAKPTVVETVQKTDYDLSCEELKLGIFETKKFKEDAEQQRDGTGANVTRSVLFWPALLKSMLNADKAVQAASDRIYHLEVLQMKKKCPILSNISEQNIGKMGGQKIDLNLATQQELKKVNGIGDIYSKRIIDYRNKLGAYTNDIQLNDIYGLDYQVINNILNEFTVKTPKEIIKMNLNKVTASDIATIPGISFELAKKIWEYRILNERIYNFSELGKIEGLTERKLQGIQLYLKVE